MRISIDLDSENEVLLEIMAQKIGKTPQSLVEELIESKINEFKRLNYSGLEEILHAKIKDLILKQRGLSETDLSPEYRRKLELEIQKLFFS